MTREEREEAIAVLKAIIPKDSRGNGKVLNTLAITKAILMGIEALEQQPSKDYIDRKVAIDALWKALYEYEDKTEKQFIESKELDVADWFQHRIFVQNMSDIDRQTILNLPSVTPQPRFLIHEDGKMEQINPQPKTSDDCISRKVLIEKLHSRFADGFDSDKWWNSTSVLCAVYGAPSVTPLTTPLTASLHTEHIIKSTIKEYIGKEYDDVTELLLALNKDLCERIRKENMNGL